LASAWKSEHIIIPKNASNPSLLEEE